MIQITEQEKKTIVKTLIKDLCKIFNEPEENILPLVETNQVNKLNSLNTPLTKSAASILLWKILKKNVTLTLDISSDFNKIGIGEYEPAKTCFNLEDGAHRKDTKFLMNWDKACAVYLEIHNHCAVYKQRCLMIDGSNDRLYFFNFYTKEGAAPVILLYTLMEHFKNTHPDIRLLTLTAKAMNVNVYVNELPDPLCECVIAHSNLLPLPELHQYGFISFKDKNKSYQPPEIPKCGA